MFIIYNFPDDCIQTVDLCSANWATTAAPSKAKMFTKPFLQKAVSVLKTIGLVLSWNTFNEIILSFQSYNIKNSICELLACLRA